MEEDKRKNKKSKSKNQKPSGDFKPCKEVKGVRFGGQFVVKHLTVRRCAPVELLRLIAAPPPPFTSTVAYLPTSFSVLAQEAWRTLTLGLGTRKSKVLIFVFESERMREAVEREWPSVIPLGEVNRKLIRGLVRCELARFKFRKGALTFYVYAVRSGGAAGFFRADDLKVVLESVVRLKDFLDHTAMLAQHGQRNITR